MSATCFASHAVHTESKSFSDKEAQIPGIDVCHFGTPS